MTAKKNTIRNFGRTSIDVEHLASTLKGRRKSLGLSQRELADRSNVGTTTIFNLEQGSCKVQLDIFLQVLEALDLIPQQVLTIDGNLCPVTPTADELQIISLIREKDFSMLLFHLSKIIDKKP